MNRNLSAQSITEEFNKLLRHQIPTIEDFIWVCKQATEIYQQFPNVINVQVESNDRVIFVRDLHGCFETQIRLFIGHKETHITPLGFPGDIVDGKRNIYLFNGYLVDRGGLRSCFVLMQDLEYDLREVVVPNKLCAGKLQNFTFEGAVPDNECRELFDLSGSIFRIFTTDYQIGIPFPGTDEIEVKKIQKFWRNVRKTIGVEAMRNKIDAVKVPNQYIKNSDAQGKKLRIMQAKPKKIDLK